MRNSVILLILLLILSRGCTSRPPQDPEFVKRLNYVNELLNEMEISPWSERFLPPASSSSSGPRADIRTVAGKPGVKFLIEYSDIALPLMFERLEKQSVPVATLIIYYMVFGHTKSAESVPYIVNYIASVSKEQAEYAASLWVEVLPQPLTTALWASEQITSLKLIDENRSFFAQRLDIAKKLRQWYEEYKKQLPPNRQTPQGSEDPGKDQHTLKPVGSCNLETIEWHIDKP